MTQEIATIDNPGISPMQMLDGGQLAADALMAIIERSGENLKIKIGKGEHLKVEAWIFLGKAHNTFAATDWVQPIMDELSTDGEVVGYEAKVNLMKDGEIAGSAIAECRLDESMSLGNHNSAKSMAQTRATSKAFRMTFAWIAVLAGYQATPAEEMPRDQDTPNKSGQYYCAEHDTEWFKSPKMTSYAHPPEKEGDEWCRKPSEKPQAKQTAPQLPRQLTVQGFVDGYRAAGLDDKQVAEILGDKAEIQARIDSGETWADLLRVVQEALQPDPPDEDLPW